MFDSKKYKSLALKVDKLYDSTIECSKQMIELSEENSELYRENKELRWEKQDLIDTLDEIGKLATSNTYGNAEAVLGKIKELSIQTANQYR